MKLILKILLFTNEFYSAILKARWKHMKSKITLVVLLSVILFLGALSFFLGYYYLET